MAPLHAAAGGMAHVMLTHGSVVHEPSVQLQVTICE